MPAPLLDQATIEKLFATSTGANTGEDNAEFEFEFRLGELIDALNHDQRHALLENALVKITLRGESAQQAQIYLAELVRQQEEQDRIEIANLRKQLQAAGMMDIPAAA